MKKTLLSKSLHKPSLLNQIVLLPTDFHNGRLLLELGIHKQHYSVHLLSLDAIQRLELTVA